MKLIKAIISLLLVFILLVPGYCFSQQFQFSDSGIMENGWAFPDRIITISKEIILPGKPYVFDKLENLQADFIPAADSGFLKKSFHDSTETFILLNTGPKSIRLKTQNFSLIAIQEALTFDHLWRPVEFWHYGWCGNDYRELELLPRQGIIFFVLKKYGQRAGKLRVRLRTETNGVIISAPFDGFIEDDLFISNSSLKKFGHDLEKDLNFLKQ